MRRRRRWIHPQVYHVAMIHSSTFTCECNITGEHNTAVCVGGHLFCIWAHAAAHSGHTARNSHENHAVRHAIILHESVSWVALILTMHGCGVCHMATVEQGGHPFSCPSQCNSMTDTCCRLAQQACCQVAYHLLVWGVHYVLAVFCIRVFLPHRVFLVFFGQPEAKGCKHQHPQY